MIPVLESLPLWMAFFPLGLYLLAIGCAHLRHRPLAISGGWDWILLGASLTGLALVGPLALVQPATGGSPWSAVLLLVLFALFVAMGALVSRPRLVIYNITPDQVRPLVADVVSALDPLARWAGSTAALPTRRLEVRIDGHGATRTVTVVAAGDRPSPEGWGEFCSRLRRALGGLQVRSSPWAGLFLFLGGSIIAVAGWFAGGSFLGQPDPPAQPASVAVPASPPREGAPDASPRRSDGT